MKKILFCYFHPSENQNYTPLDVGCLVALVKDRFPREVDVKIVPLSFFSRRRPPGFFAGRDAIDFLFWLAEKLYTSG